MMKLRSIPEALTHASSWVLGALAVLLLTASFSPPANAQQQDETLRVGIWNLSNRLGNPHASASQPFIYHWPAMFDGLTIFDADGNVTAALATSWELVDDTTWRFRLRPGVTFQNGEPFTADAVVAVIKFLTSEAGRGMGIFNEMRSLSDARAVDDLTVEILTSKPNPIMPRLAAAIRITAPKYWADAGLEEFSKAPIGTGPFKVVEWAPDKVSMEAFAGSWRAPKVSGLELISLPDVTARLQGLQSNQIDIALGLNAEMIPALEADGHKMSVTPGTGVRVIVFRATPEDSPFRDPRVRLALNYAVDREAMNAAFFNNMGIPAGQPAPRAAFGYDPSIEPYPYDIEKAKSLLAEAGFKPGTKTTMETLSTEVGGFEAVYQRLPQELAKVGLEVEHVTITIPDLIGRLFNRKPWVGWSFAFGFDTSPAMDAIRLDRWHTCNNNFAPWYCDDGAQKLVDAAAVEMDPEKRRELLHKVMRKYHDEPPGIILFEEIDFDGLHKRVHDFEIVTRQIKYEKISLAR